MVSPIFTSIKTCNNACPFCFIDQQPEGLRPSLYVKDDDYRLSYFNNTYITLTNLTPHDRARMERLRPGPLYVSVHCTVPEIRERLLVNKKHAGKIMDELRWLKSLEIPFHCQVVLCPGINDGEHLARTLLDLAALRPEATDRVLEIGTGSGYAAAVLSRIVREVYTIERHAELADLARRRMAASPPSRLCATTASR